MVCVESQLENLLRGLEEPSGRCSRVRRVSWCCPWGTGMLLQPAAPCQRRGSQPVLSKHSHAKSFPLQLQGLHEEQRGLFPSSSPWQLSNVLWLHWSEEIPTGSCLLRRSTKSERKPQDPGAPGLHPSLTYPCSFIARSQTPTPPSKKSTGRNEEWCKSQGL